MTTFTSANNKFECEIDVEIVLTFEENGIEMYSNSEYNYEETKTILNKIKEKKDKIKPKDTELHTDYEVPNNTFNKMYSKRKEWPFPLQSKTLKEMQQMFPKEKMKIGEEGEYIIVKDAEKNLKLLIDFLEKCVKEKVGFRTFS